MEVHYWQDKWDRNDIGFHEAEVNALLKAHINTFKLTENARVFVPLCGMSRDIAWLLDKGFYVVGIEWVEKAVEQLFQHLELQPEITQQGELIRYTAENIDIYVGDVFLLTTEHLGSVDLVYDRAAIVALPTETRTKYGQTLSTQTHCAPQLVITFEYDQTRLQGPPFSINDQELSRLYSKRYGIEKLKSQAVIKLKNTAELNAFESIWKLTPL